MTISSSRFIVPLLTSFAIGAFAGCDKDESARSTTASASNKAQSTVASTAAATSAPKARDSELLTPAVAPQPPAPPAQPEPPAPMTPPPAQAAGTPPPVARMPALPAPAMTENVQPASSADAWDEIKDYTYAQKSELVDRVKAMTSDFDAAVASVRSSSAKTEFADSRSTALAALEEVRSVVAQKREALENASAETWLSAKAEFRSTWKNAQAAYDKAKMMSN